MSKIVFKPLKGLQNRQYEISTDILTTPSREVKYHIIRASRQSGKTFMLERLAAYLSFDKPNQMGAFIMATNAQTRKVFNSLILRLPKNLVDSTNNTDASRYILFVNGTKLNFFSSNAYNSVVGNTFDFLICDEFALWNKMAWGYIRPTVAAKRDAKIIIASTPRGKNDFYTLCIEGMNADGFTRHYRMSWRDNKHYDEREVLNAKKTLPEQIFLQEYEAEFIFGNSQVFGIFSDNQTINVYPSREEEKQYFYGIDWSGDGEDKTVITIIDEDGNVVEINEYDGNNHVTLVDSIYADLIKYKKIKGYSESNGLGKGATDMLSFKLNSSIVRKFYMSNDSKQDLVGIILECLSSREVHLPTPDLCPQLDNEMSMYQVSRTATGKLKYSHAEGMHDDYVDSLLMALKARKELRYEISSVVNYDEIDFNYNSDIYNYD